MRTRVLFALVLVAALPVVVNAQAPCNSGSTYMSGTVIGGPMYAATPMYSSPGYTMVERTGPLGLMRWRTMEPTPTVMPAPVMTATTGMPTTGVMPAMATTTMPMTTPMVGQTYTSVERTGPLGLMRWRTMEPTPTFMPAPIMTTPTPTAVMPAGATMPIPGTATTSTGVITGNYVVPSTSTTTVMPANYYTYERTGLFGRRYYVTPMSMDSTVMPASYAVPSTTYYYPQYSTYPQYSSGRYFGFGGFGFWMR